MADEFDFEIENPEEERQSRVEKRIESLSKKVELTAKERDEIAEKAQKAEEARIAAERERDYYASFADVITNHPQASEYKDVIKEKVLSGYTVEDATFAVLGKEGKLGAQPQVKSPIGGSASTTVTEQPEKSVKDMNQEERLKTLLELEKKGDIFLG